VSYCIHCLRLDLIERLTHQGDSFPELKTKQGECKRILDSEETSFAQSLHKGEKLFKTYASKALTEGNDTLDGADVWRLYDTYGFPVDLTRLMAEERELRVDEATFTAARDKSIAASKIDPASNSNQVVRLDVHDLGLLEKSDWIEKTNDDFKYRKTRLTTAEEAGTETISSPRTW
jgi:alanyl-tRNA synthetase